MAVNALAYYRDGVWEELTPRAGWLAYVQDSQHSVVFDGLAWTARVKSQTADTVALKMEHAGAGNECEFEMFFNSPSPAANDVLAQRYYFNNASGGKVLGLAINGVLLDATAGSEDTEYRFSTAAGGAVANRLRVGGGVYHPSASGGDLGPNTINFGAVYDDNTLLTCGPVELMREGCIDLDKWDALAPAQRDAQTGEMKRRHAVMHRFVAMLEEGFDPRDAENYCARLAADGAPPGLITEREWRERAERGLRPDMGTMHTHALLALDNLAVAFASLVRRVAALERAALGG
jgi:hypothetical protein